MARIEGRRPSRDDRRSRRTRRTLGEALLALMLEKRYDTITVQEIIDRANVGRSTFYSHFLDKEDLLQHEVADLVHRLTMHMDRSAGGNRIVPSIELFRHLHESRDLIRALVRGRAMDTVLKTMHAHLADHVRHRLVRRLPPGAEPALPLELVAHYVAGVILNLFDWWQEHDMRQTPEEIDAYFTQLCDPTLRATTGIEV
ncbi:MAG TPA: TetR/AcrR family transcriptional regulator [Chloroflexia bacterium]|nr:TetR/AcrR family transcriptional regulator [Chloroflexia bacterium]